MKILKQIILVIFNVIILYALFDLFKINKFEFSVYYLTDFLLFTSISLRVFTQYIEDSLFEGHYTDDKANNLEKKLLGLFLK